MNEEEKAIIEEKIIECYKLKNITFDDETLYKELAGKKLFKTSKDMPILEDLYNILGDTEKTKLFNIKYGMFLFIECFWDKIKADRSTKKAIYLDEIWRLIGVTSNKYVASFIYRIFKTIRKYGGSAVAITQDVSDLFSLENRNLWKKYIE